MDVLLTLVVLTLPSVTSGLQTCSSGTETSSNQILLDVSTTQINTGEGMCFCKLTVTQTAQVEMFPIDLTQQCDTYTTIQKWRTTSQCTNGVVQTIPAQTHTVNTGEEIWILVVATPGARGLSGHLQFRIKSSSVQLNIECFEPNTNSSTTTPLSTTSVSTSSSTFTTTTSPQTTVVTTTTERVISTSQPTTETQRPTSITLQGLTTSLSTGVTAGAETSKDPTTQIPKKSFRGLQTCSSGTETSSNQILLDVSTSQINTGGGMCSCRLTVSQTSQVDLFVNSLTQQCDTRMTIQKWRTSSQCINHVVQTITGQSHTVTTGEEIWILVVALPGASGLSGQLQFRIKSSSGHLNIECFEPNTNSSTSTGSLSTKPLTFTTTTSPKTTAVTTTTERLTSTPPHATETLRPTAITPQGQTTSMSTGLTAGPGTTKATFITTQISLKGCQSRNNDFPGGIFAAGVATGAVLVVIAGALYVVTSRRWWRSRHEKSDDIPVSEVHPTYSGLKPRTQEPSNTYDIIDPNPPKGTANPYINVP